MPRVKALKEKGDYVPAQFNSYLVAKRLRQSEIAEWIGVTQSGVWYKITHHTFTLQDAAVIFARSGATPEEIMKVLRL